MRDLIPAAQLPAWFAYPPEFITALAESSIDVGSFWQFLEGEWLVVRFGGLKRRFPCRDLIPFARRLDDDDVACWERETFPAVQIVHDFAAPGWEAGQAYESFSEWLLAARADIGTDEADLGRA